MQRGLISSAYLRPGKIINRSLMRQLSAFMELLKRRWPLEASGEGHAGDGARMFPAGHVGFSQGPASAKLVMSPRRTPTLRGEPCGRDAGGEAGVAARRGSPRWLLSSSHPHLGTGACDFPCLICRNVAACVRPPAGPRHTWR